MSPKEFCIWLEGYLEGIPPSSSEGKWLTVKEKLLSVLFDSKSFSHQGENTFKEITPRWNTRTEALDPYKITNMKGE